jgi:hypothetical protein
MEATRIELAVEQMDWIDSDEAGEYSCDDLRTALLCAELNRSAAGLGSSFEAVWLDR